MMWLRVSILVIILAGCSGESPDVSSTCTDLKTKVVNLEKEVASHVSFDENDSSNLMKAYANFTNACPEDSIVPEYLVRRADLLRGLVNFMSRSIYLKQYMMVTRIMRIERSVHF